jgi:diaminopimelate decarboxylase
MPFSRDDRGAALLGGVRLDALLDSPRHTTPAYVYDLDAMEASARALSAGFGDARHIIAYAVKANTAGPILRALQSAGCGAEVVSGGELAAALGVGFDPDTILYSGVAKLDHEIDHALGVGAQGILSIQVESVEEIARVAARARALGRRGRISLRVNPGVEADTHAAVATGHDEAKFGIAVEDLGAAWDALAHAPELTLQGVSCHIGSQLTTIAQYVAAADVLLGVAAAREASSGPLAFIDFGGGFGIDYGAGCPAAPADFAAAAAARVAASPLRGRTITVEPGRALVAAHGVLCADVVMAKRTATRRWLMIDAGMNDLLRPALYGARHRIEPMDAPPPRYGLSYRVVGPVCESTDDFGEHPFAEPLPRRVVIRDAGAYGYTMASEYNGRPLPMEIFVSDGCVVSVSAPRNIDAWVRDRLQI